ncbi:MAG: hypothetical protein LBK99_06735 [Opitutaceae bacterium]|jgi:hypothetical protein|nr:hypothetical protein [Opitutaceae bacterium]
MSTLGRVSSVIMVMLCVSGAVAARLTLPPPAGFWLPVIGLGLAVWIAFGLLLSPPRHDNVVLRLWGLEWKRDEACCHFFITGSTGTGKTARTVVPIVHGLRSSLPSTGILAVDSMGALWKPLSEIARALGQEDSLRLIRVRPPHIPSGKWNAPLKMNVLADRSIPWGTYAKIIVDTASAAGQRGGQTFFKESARDVITHAMQALDAAGLLVTLDNVHNAICNSADTAELIAALDKTTGDAAAAERQFFKDFSAQPPEQRSGTVYTVANYLRP